MLAKILSGEKYQYIDCHLPVWGGFTEYCPGFPLAEDSRPKCVFKSLELLDLTSIPQGISAHICFTHNNKSMQSENINHFPLQEYNKSDDIRKTLTYTSQQTYTKFGLADFYPLEYFWRRQWLISLDNIA